MGVLQRGSRGDEVTALQNNLAKLGFAVDSDGIFGGGTQTAVEELQAAFGYTVDGKVGSGTNGLIEAQMGHGWSITAENGVKRALESQGKTTDKGSLAGADLSQTLRKGADGGEVSYLQRRLNVLGISVGVSGKFDDATETAVKALQEAKGYNVDGIVGPATNTLINSQIGHGWTHG